MTKIVSIANQKGGVGKTTTAVNLATMLALTGHRTLLADLDPQANATSGLGLPRVGSAEPLRFLLDDEAPPPAPVPSCVSGLDVLPTGPSMAELEPLLWRREDRFDRLRRALAPLRPLYDYVLLDCPPALGLFPMNALAVSDSILLPIQCEFFAMEGLAQILETIRKAKKRFNPALEIEGILLTMHEDEAGLATEVEAEVRSFFKNQVYATVIPRDEALAEAASHGRPVFIYRCSARGTRAYVELAKEVINS
jgi:chromosome partitioning protein